ncbi:MULTISPECIES: aldose 1-epimerase family protein [Methylobacterium]|uniref:Protein LacX, plasmid n=1 Tax=Methylobacterium thuringiense TaxID=1003091 RepID=A0ABQ4TQF1_9HYPH|nr:MULTISPECIES: aldose 1-epimerase family protein [Methylobacterium]TXN24186.1 aldose 1-epimerase family protein [Methylobacterium sp. WL9]GJE56265.1 Protein LacX, plasmid [Methylobacterium thuringiense]
MSETIEIRAADGTSARIALQGAEPVSWQVAGREYLWNGDPEHWNRHAPWLFPVVGASAGGVVRVDGQTYPMGQHGFARDLPFSVVTQSEDAVTLRLEDGDATRTHYPFAFRLDIDVRVDTCRLLFVCKVENTGETPLPYGLGFHPAFPWPFADGERRAGGGYHVVFDATESPDVPEIAEGGLIAAETRAVPLIDTTLPLDPEMFKEALVFLDAKSRSMRFVGPGDKAIAMAVEDFPHFAIWTKPTAPFLSLECWTGHADRAGFEGELAERDSQRILAPGAQALHGVGLSLQG